MPLVVFFSKSICTHTTVIRNKSWKKYILGVAKHKTDPHQQTRKWVNPPLLNNSSQWQLPPSHAHTLARLEEPGAGESWAVQCSLEAQQTQATSSRRRGSKFQSRCWSQLQTGARLRDDHACVRCQDTSPRSQRRGRTRISPTMKWKQDGRETPKPTEVAFSTGTLIWTDGRQWQPNPSEDAESKWRGDAQRGGNPGTADITWWIWAVPSWRCLAASSFASLNACAFDPRYYTGKLKASIWVMD